MISNFKAARNAALQSVVLAGSAIFMLPSSSNPISGPIPQRVDELLCKGSEPERKMIKLNSSITIETEAGCDVSKETVAIENSFKRVIQMEGLSEISLYITPEGIIKNEKRAVIGVVMKADQHSKDEKIGSKSIYYLYDATSDTLTRLSQVYLVLAVTEGKRLLERKRVVKR